VKNTVVGATRATDAIMATPGQPEWKNIWTLDHVAREMQSAEFGLRNLRSTYATDAGTIAALHVISERLEAHCEVIRRFLELPHGGKRSPQLGPLHSPGAPSTRNEQHCGLENESVAHEDERNDV
jgi:hypothetical protein